jgi:hypothetical protein
VIEIVNTAFNARFIKSWPAGEPIPVEAWRRDEDGRYAVRVVRGPLLALADGAGEAHAWIEARGRLALQNEPELVDELLLA